MKIEKYIETTVRRLSTAWKKGIEFKPGPDVFGTTMSALGSSWTTATKIDYLKKIIFHGHDLVTEMPNSMTTTLLDPEFAHLLQACLGMVGETGEFAYLVWLRLSGSAQDVTRDQMVKELGDVYWYFFDALDACGISFDEVLEANSAKLWKRYPDGFSSEASRTRTE